MPYLYQYALEREVAGRRQQISGQIGIRRLGREGGNLRLDGKRWVLRAAQSEEISCDNLPAWHEASTAAVVTRSGIGNTWFASEIGVLFVVELTDPKWLEDSLRRLRSEASVGIVILDRDIAPLSLRSWARNMLFAQKFQSGETVHVDDWADVAICEIEGRTPAAPAVEGRLVPLIAWRPGGKGLFPEGGRALCDLLQRDLAESGINWAGYIV